MFHGSSSWLANAFVSLLFASAIIPSASCLGRPGRGKTAALQAANGTQTNGTLPYLDASLPIDDRVEDLLQRMTLEEKAGQLFHMITTVGENGTLATGVPSQGFDTNSTVTLVSDMHMTHFNLLGDFEDVRLTAEWYNRLQELALSTRLGIPITLSTDARHGTNPGNKFSQWPSNLGFAALRDPDLVQKFTRIAREEYMSIGIRCALSPTVDVATEPRWARIGETMGEDANLTSQLAQSYLGGFQGKELGAHSVTTITKHFPGAGPAEDGELNHFAYGKNVTYPGNNQEYHLLPFKAAIAAGARQMMVSYSRPVGTEYEEIGTAFNKALITDLLRKELGFTGIVVTDWYLITDVVLFGQDMPAKTWGVEYLSELERVTRILDAGVDQFGGEQRPELVVEAVTKGLITTDRIDVSVRRLLREKFTLGLFENRFVDVDAAVRIAGNPAFRRQGDKAQRKSYTLLTNNNDVLPLKHRGNLTFYTEGIDPEALAPFHIRTTSNPAEADMALMRLETPFEPRPGGFEKRYRAGSLEYNATEKARQAAIFAAVPTIVDLHLERPAAVPEIADQAAALLGNYGATVEAFLDVVFGVQGAGPMGKLPFDLPRSQKAVEASREDVPFDTEDPVFRFGHGLRYAGHR